MQWLRLYTEVRHDRKLRRLSPSQRWLWIVMLTIARESPEPGKLLLSENLPVTNEDLADEAAISTEEVEEGIEVFKKQNMVSESEGTYCLNNWDKRQFTSDNSTERVKRYRNKQSQENCNGDETLQERYSNKNETPPESESESETEPEYKESSSQPSAATSNSDKQNNSNSSKKTKTFSEESTEFKLACLLRTEILKNLPDARVPRASPDDMRGWCVHIDRMIRIDNRDPTEIAKIIKWCQNDPFWSSNILSTKKLREKWETLLLQAKKRGENSNGKPAKENTEVQKQPGKYMRAVQGGGT